MLNYALSYAERGWRVLPLHSIIMHKQACTCLRQDCTSPGKHPRTLHGVKDASTDERQVHKWWGMWPNANIGLACGAKSGFVVIDVDPRNGGVESIKAFIEEHGVLPFTIVSHTGGNGFHYLFSYPTPAGISKRVLASGVDLVSDGGYIVAPPSIHISGHEYRWLVGYDPLHQHLGELPEWVMERFQSHTVRIEAGENVPFGERNLHFIRIAGSMRKWGLGYEAIFAALSIHDDEVCDPPMGDKEVERIARSVCRYEPDHDWEDEPKKGPTVRIEDCSLDEGSNGSSV